MDRCVIGVDGGASKTAAVVVNEQGQVLGRGTSGPSNYHLVGLESARAALVVAMAQAANRAGIDVGLVSAATWALAGAAGPSGQKLFRRVADEILPGIPVQIEHDALAALVGGVGNRYGVVLNAGSGTIAYGENMHGQQARAAGWGHLLDQGNAYSLVQEALRAITRASDGADLPTCLTEDILEFLGLGEPLALVDWLYAPDRRIAEISSLTPLVLSAAERGDLVARDVIMRGANALATAVEAVSRRLGFWDKPFPLVLAGGLFAASAYYREIVLQTVCARIPGANPIHPQVDPAVGAAMLALETLGHPLGSAVQANSASGNTWVSERSNVLSRDLDLRSTREIVGLMHLEDGQAVKSIRPYLPVIAEAVEAIAARMSQGGRLIYVGAGTAGRLGTLDAAECPPTFNASPQQVTAIIAGGQKALTSAVEAAEDDQEAGCQAVIEAGIGSLDSVVGISASGRTPFVLGALKEAKLRGGLSVALICNLPAPMATIADYVIAPLVGPEVLTGSTRLKAGTAQKLVLNMLSTAVMIRLGKTYGNLMVDLRQQSAKLEQRARRIVAAACNIGEEEARVALANSEGDVKVAIVSTLLSCTAAEARGRLVQVEGKVRAALAQSLQPVAQET